MPTYLKQLEEWHAAGQLRFRETIVEGLDRAPEAFCDLFTGRNIGNAGSSALTTTPIRMVAQNLGETE